MKNALYIGINAIKDNPHLLAYKDSIAGAMRVTFFGPGYPNFDENLRVLEDTIRDKNIDVIFFDRWLLNPHKARAFKRNNSHFFYFPPGDYSSFFHGCKKLIERFPKIVFVGNCDVHNLAEEECDYLEKTSAYILNILPSLEEHLAFLEECNSGSKEPDTGNGSRIELPKLWFSLIKNNRERVIDFPHMVYDSEIFISSMQSRAIEIPLLGAMYPERKEARTFRFVNGKKNVILNLIRKSSKSLFTPKRSEFSIFLVRALYSNTLRNSRLAYVSGSPLRWPVRKYFEVAAAGAIPIGKRCIGLADLGFYNGKNFVEAQNAEDFEKALRHFSKRPEIWAEMVGGAVQLIRNSHTVRARSDQLTDCLKLIDKHEFCGAIWENGRFTFRHAVTSRGNPPEKCSR